MFKFKFCTNSVRTFVIFKRKMGHCFQGRISMKADELNLDLTLLGGQSFRWRKTEGVDAKPTEWRGVAYDAFWILTQSADTVHYKVWPASAADGAGTTEHHYNELLQRYLRADFNLAKHVAQWKQAHSHFGQITNDMKAVRVLEQQPLENILSFICSQNNHIRRISTMIDWLCSKYGKQIGQFEGRNEYTFPALTTLVEQQTELEGTLRAAKFGYRAKFIAQTIAKVAEHGGDIWFDKLRQLPYVEARLQLVTLPGIGFKVADCICLMSLGHLESVPIDTHIYKIAQRAYMPHLAKVKAVTPKIYDEIANHFRTVYGPTAGWAQAVLFCSDLQQFQEQGELVKEANDKCGKKRRK